MSLWFDTSIQLVNLEHKVWGNPATLKLAVVTQHSVVARVYQRFVEVEHQGFTGQGYCTRGV